MTKVVDQAYNDNPRVYPAPASTAIAVGDLLYVSSGVARPASAQADTTTPATNYSNFATAFIGVALSSRSASDAVAGTVNVASADFGRYVELPCVAAAFNIGDTVGAIEQSNGTQLENQLVQKTTTANQVIGTVVRHYASNTTRVWIKLAK